MSKATRPPGPTLLESLSIARTFKRGDVSPLERLSARYGDVAYVPFPIDAYVLSAPQWVEQVLVTKQRNYIKSRNYRQMRYAMGRGLVTSDGDEWAQKRRNVTRAFHSRAVRSYAATIAHHAADLTQRWQESDPPGAFDLAPELAELSCRIASQLLFGASAPRVAHDVHRWAQIAGDAVVRRIYSPLRIPRFIPTAHNRAERRAVESLDRVIYGVIDQPRRSAGPLTVLDLLRGAVDDSGRPSMSRKQLRDELMTLFLAAHDTICASLLWFYYLVGSRPEVDAAIAREVQTVCGDDDITSAHLAKLTYLEAAFLEAMRLYPAIPVIARTPLTDDHFGPHRVPAGSVVLLPVIWLHRDPARWERPTEFVPQRFLHGPKQPPGGYLPFSVGPRKCIGDQLAMLEALTIIATIARTFSLRLAPGFEPHPHTTITMAPQNGLMVHRTPR